MKRKKLFSIILSLVLVISSFSTIAFAADETSDTESNSSTATETVNIGKKYTDKQLGISSAGKKLDKKYRSVLIAGIDNGGRSDVIIILSINKSTGAAKISSVTRDTYMQISDKKKYTIDGKVRDFAKCNKAYELGSDPALQMLRELNRHLDLNLREYIAVSWECTADLVDELNSMGYKVTGKITNSSMKNAINKLTPIESKITKTGTVSLKGWQAVQYLRVRKYTGGDANARETRDRAFLIQLSKTAKKMKLSEVQQVYDAVKGRLQTNMNWEELNTMLSHLGTIKDDSHAKTWPYKWTSLWDPDGYFTYAIPTNLTDNVKAMHKELYPKVSYTPSSTEKSLNKKIENKRKNYLKKKRPTLASASIKTPAGAYTSKGAKAHPVVKLGGRTLIEGSDYKVTSYKNNKNVGNKATFKIKGVYYTGSKKGSFTVVPAGTELAEPTGIDINEFTVNWEKQSKKMSKSRITGYQVQYSTKKSFSSATKKTVKGYSKTSLKITGLDSGTEYFVRIRTYMKKSGKTYYSPWSEAQTIETE